MTIPDLPKLTTVGEMRQNDSKTTNPDLPELKTVGEMGQNGG